MIQNDLDHVGLSANDIRALAQWCQSRRFRFRPMRTDAPEQEILLEPVSRTSAWQRLTLAASNGTYRLADEWGEILAEASTLHPVLDALDGGIAHTILPTLTSPSFLFV